MGKKRIVVPIQDELLKEREKVEAAVVKERQVRAGKKIQTGRIYIASSYNNTIMTLSDLQGNTLAWVSAGSIGFKGTKKATPFAASKVAEALVQITRRLGITDVEVLVRGVGSGRDSAIRSLAARGLELTLLKDVTPIPHNGCRRPKARRV